MKSLLFATTLALSATMATPATAATQSVTDGSEDVYSGQLGDVDPLVQGADIQKTTFKYRDKLRVTVQVSSLTLASTTQLRVHFVDPKGRDYNVSVRRFEAGGFDSGFTRDGVPVDCTPVRLLDFDEGIAQLTVDASCFGSPRWIRVGARLVVSANGDVFTDDARRFGIEGDYAKLGGKLARG